MKNILEISNELSKALQGKEQDIVNVMTLVRICKEQLQVMRDNGWDSILNKVASFCAKYEIIVHNMNDRRPRRRAEEIINLNLYHYCVEYH